jgi:hypothetical protein
MIEHGWQVVVAGTGMLGNRAAGEQLGTAGNRLLDEGVDAAAMRGLD